MGANRHITMAFVAGALGLFVVAGGCVEDIDMGAGYHHLRADLRMVVNAMLEEGMEADSDRLVILRGNVHTLERWLTQIYQSSQGRHRVFLINRTGLVRVAADGSVQLRDPWDQRIAYECLDPGTGYVARVYSFGPNRVDEGGAGDDICEMIPMPGMRSGWKIAYRDE